MKIKYINRPFHNPNIKINTAISALIRNISLQYGSYIGDIPYEDTCEITIKQTTGKDCILTYDKNEVTTHTTLYDIDQIIYSITTYDEAVLALHGSAVSWNGKAYLFIASTTSGKTTLASYLTNTGFDYITDDCILLDKSNFMVHPYTCPIHLRDGGLEVLKKYGASPDNLTLLDDPVVRRSIYTPKNCVRQPLPLGQIYFISRSETENKVINLNASESILELIKAPMIPYTVNSNYLRLISNIALTSCTRLIYKDMQFVADTIKRGENNG